MILINKQFHIYYLTILLFLLHLVPITAQSGFKTLTILPEKDLQVSSTKPDKVFNTNADGLKIHSEQGNGQVNYEQFSYLQFSLAAVPKNIKIESISLRIYLDAIVDASREQAVRVYPLMGESKWNADFNWNNRPAQDTPVSEKKSASYPNPTDPSDLDVGVNLKLSTQKFIDPDNPNYISLLIAAGTENYTYYSTRSAKNDDKYSLQPKLIIEYSQTSVFQPGVWAQMRQDPQHSGQQTWSSNVSPKLVQAKEIIYGGESFTISRVNPVIYDNDLIFAVQQSGTGNVAGNYLYRYALSNPGDVISVSPKLDDIIKHQPIITPNGQLVCILGNSGKKVSVYNINNSFEQDTTFSVEASVTATPVIGTDGSIYLSTKKGLVAYSSDYNIKWEYSPLSNNQNHHFGSVTLSEDEKRAYVVFGDEKKLIVFDNTDGAVLNDPDPLFSKYTDGDEIKVPIPIIDASSGKVYVIDGFRKAKKFFVFDQDGKLVKEFSGCSNNNECYSQVVITQTGATLIQNGKLTKYISESQSLKALRRSTNLNPASSLLSDQEGNIYVLDTEGGKAKMTIYVELADDDVQSDLFMQNATDLVGNRLLMAPDGNLVIGNDNYVVLLSPKGLLIDETVATPWIINQLNDQTVYRTSTSIRVNENVTHYSPNNTIIYAGQTISFQKGFKVKKGAKLTCKIGY